MAFSGRQSGPVSDRLSNGTVDLLCLNCEEKKRNREAEKHCSDFNDSYCLRCIKIHDDVPVPQIGRHNDVLALTRHKGQLGTSQAPPLMPNERCNRQNLRNLRHTDDGCSTCRATDRRSCQDIFYILEYSQSSTHLPKPQVIQKSLDTSARSLKECHEKFQKEKDRLQQNKNKSSENINKLREEINDRLDKLEQNSLAEVDGRYKPLFDQINEEMYLIQTTRAIITSTHDNIESAGNNESQMFVSMEQASKVISKAEQCVEESRSHIHGVDIDFVKDYKILTLLNEMNSLGDILQKDINGKCEQTGTRIVKPKETDLVVTKPNASLNVEQKEGNGDKTVLTTKVLQRDASALYQSKEMQKYNIGIQSDILTCYIYSASALEDGTIILADYYNCKVKHVNSSTYSVVDYCDLPACPWQLCLVSKHEVAVSCVEAGVQFISLGRKMMKSKQMKTDHYCYGIACADGDLYISDSRTSVYIYSLSGRKLKQFSTDQSGQELFSDISSLAVSNDGSKIYVADTIKGLMVLETNGNVLANFNGSLLEGTRYVCVTDNGSVLVCGDISKNVVQFNGNGELVGEVLKIGNDGDCCSICSDPRNSKLIAGFAGNEIEVYDLVNLEHDHTTYKTFS